MIAQRVANELDLLYILTLPCGFTVLNPCMDDVTSEVLVEDFALRFFCPLRPEKVCDQRMKTHHILLAISRVMKSQVY